MPRPKKRRKVTERGVPVSIWLRLDLVVSLDRAAEKENVSRSALVERAIERELAVKSAA